MNDLLKAHMRAVWCAYRAHSGLADSTAARKITGDSRFFVRLDDPGISVTGRKYDAVMMAFSRIWPADLAWPAHVARPVVGAGEQTGQG